MSLRQEKFVVEYLKDGNGTQAAIRAGYSPKGADVRAIQLLAIDRIAAKIEAGRNRILSRTEISVGRVLREFACLAFLDPAKLFNAQGELLPIREMPEDARRALAGIEIEELFEYERGSRSQVGNLRKIRLTSKLGALETLAKHLGMLRERVEHTGKDGRPIEFSAVDWRNAMLEMMGETLGGAATGAKPS
jgi:phage terminase small subunit